MTSSLFPLVSQQLFDHYEKGWHFLGQLSLLFLMVIVINLLMEYCNRVWEWKISKQLAILLKADLFERFLSLDHQTFDQKDPIDYVSHINNNVAAVSEDYFSAIIDLSKSGLKLLIFCLSMTYVLNWQLTVVILIFSMITSYLPTLTRKRLGKLRKDDLVFQNAYNHKLLDLLSGSKYVSAQTIGIFKEQHESSLIQSEAYHYQFGRFQVFSDMMYSFGTNVMYLVIFILAGYFLISGQMTLGRASASLLYTSSLIGAINDVLSCVNVLHSSKEIVQELSQELERPVLKETPLFPKQVEELSLEYLDFERGAYHLSATNLHLRVGERVALVGHSGAGKTTFFNLLNGDLRPRKEKILLDGHPLTQLMKEEYLFTLRQKEHLFDGDLMTNVTLFGQLPVTADMKELVERLPENIRWRLQQYGSINELSGGERQVISILRSLNMPYPILLLDEPFSQIDMETKTIISAFLSGLTDRIIIEITHDLNFVCQEHYDAVYVLSDGVVRQRYF